MIQGPPIALARPRFASRTRIYDSQRHQKLVHQMEIRQQYELYHQPDLLLSGKALLLDVTFGMEIPKSHQKRKDQLLNTAHIFKPDLSNLIKYIEDVCTGILYADDCLISNIIARKIYVNVAHTMFTIRVMKGLLV